jgi:hypothetical protein
MSHPAVPRRRALRAAAVTCSLLALPALLPGSAAADAAAANTWGGGTAGAAPSRVTGRGYAERGALVSVVTTASRARLRISLRSDRCTVNGTLRGTTTVQPGGTGDLLALSVTARRTITTDITRGRTRARVSVALTPAAPGVLVGTVEARGRVALRGRNRPCRMREAVTVRSRAVLATPPAAATTAPAVLRTGIVETRVTPGVRGAIALAPRSDGSLHGFWTFHQTCRSGSKRSADDFVNVAKRFRVRADGSFRSRESVVTRNRVKGGRERLHFVATISGRIGPDGVARGTVSMRSRSRLKGYDDLVCRMPSTPFAAAPTA